MRRRDPWQRRGFGEALGEAMVALGAAALIIIATLLAAEYLANH